MKTQLITLQFALFFKDIVQRPDIEFRDINENMFNIFDAIPQIIPLPKELPPDVPMIIHRSENNEYVCNISRVRIDVIVQRTNQEKANYLIIIKPYIDKKTLRCTLSKDA